MGDQQPGMSKTPGQPNDPFSDVPRELGKGGSALEKATDRLLRINVDGRVIIKLGSAIAHYGDIKFDRLPPLKAKGLEDKLILMASPLAVAEGKGTLYCATQGWRTRILRLAGQTVHVSANELLAFDDSLEVDMFVVGEGLTIASGGLFVVKLSGTGSVALAVHGDAIVLPVKPGMDLRTDPHATVAWTDGLVPTMTTDITWRTFIKKGSGEAFQMHFSGTGEVLVQPAEDPAKFTLSKLRKLI